MMHMKKTALARFFLGQQISLDNSQFASIGDIGQNSYFIFKPSILADMLPPQSRDGQGGLGGLDA